MAGLLKTAAAYFSFGLLTLLGFLTVNMLPASVTAEEVVQSVADYLFPGTAIDPDTLVKFDDQEYSVSYADTVSPHVLATSTVRKIGYGRSETVTITSTESGTYSSDAMFSPNIRYPGIEVARAEGLLGEFDLFGSNSFLFLLQTDGGTLIIGKEGSCLIDDDAIQC